MNELLLVQSTQEYYGPASESEPSSSSSSSFSSALRTSYKKRKLWKQDTSFIKDVSFEKDGEPFHYRCPSVFLTPSSSSSIIAFFSHYSPLSLLQQEYVNLLQLKWDIEADAVINKMEMTVSNTKNDGKSVRRVGRSTKVCLGCGYTSSSQHFGKHKQGGKCPHLKDRKNDVYNDLQEVCLRWC